MNWRGRIGPGPALGALALVILTGATAARCERLVISLTSPRVLISSSFTGVDLVLFGGVERDPGSPARRGGYDLVVTVTGPRGDMVTRRKDRVAGIWVNVEARTFIDAPAYLAVLSNRPLPAIAGADARGLLHLGLAQTLLRTNGMDDPQDDAFRTAFIELNRQHGRYREETDAVRFLTPDLFRAAIELPADAPLGVYDVDAKLFADGALLARQNVPLETTKVGFEQFVASAAHEHGLLYGLATAALALLTGWFGSVLFRRD